MGDVQLAEVDVPEPAGFAGEIFPAHRVPAYAACRECGISGETAAGVLSGYLLKNGRMQTFRLGAPW